MKSKYLCLILVFLLTVQNLQSQNFQPYIEILTTDQIVGVKIGDLNNDGLNDVITSYGANAGIKIQFQNADHTLQPFITLPVSGYKVTSFDVGDLNQDGLTDIFLTFENYYGIFYQKSSGGFEALQKFDTGRKTGVIRIADLNKDNKNDVVFTNSNNVNILYQTTAGTFTTEIIALTHYFGELRIADINSDQRNDLIFTSWPTKEIFTFLQKESGGFHNPVKTFVNTAMAGMAVGDLNNDGLTDVLTTQYENSSSSLKVFYPSLNSYIFYSYIEYAAVNRADTVEIADFDNDGKNEIVTGSYGYNTCSIYGSSYNNFKRLKTIDIPYYNHSEYQSLAVGDINNDGFKDIVFTKQNGMVILYNSGNSLNTTAINKETAIGLFPNPATNQLNFKINFKGNSYFIHDFSGKLIKNGIVDLNNQINISLLSAGNYILSITNQSEKIHSQKFTKK